MNNKILELAKLAGLEQVSPEKLELFTELIINDCIDICDHSIRQNSSRRDQTPDFLIKSVFNYGVQSVEIISGNIKEHFGVRKYD